MSKFCLAWLLRQHRSADVGVWASNTHWQEDQPCPWTGMRRAKLSALELWTTDVTGLPQFARYIGIDYSCAVTPESSCIGLRVRLLSEPAFRQLLARLPSPWVNASAMSRMRDAPTMGVSSPRMSVDRFTPNGALGRGLRSRINVSPPSRCCCEPFTARQPCGQVDAQRHREWSKSPQRLPWDRFRLAWR